MEADREAYFDTQALLMNQHAQLLQEEVNEIRRNRERQVNEYRHTFQKKNMAREFDLNDAAALRRDIPARVGDDDPRCGASSLQQFEGEDLDAPCRQRAMAEQQQRWAAQQIDEKIMKKWMEAEAANEYAKRSEEVNYRTWQMQQAVAARRAQAATATATFNKKLAEQQRDEGIAEKRRQDLLKQREVYAQMSSDFLTEQESVVSAAGNTKKAERFKGLGREALARIFAEQAAQQEALQQQRRDEAQEERALGQLEVMDNRMAILLDTQQQREKRQVAVSVARDQVQQMEEAAARRRVMKETFANAVGEEYFRPFGQCLR